MKRYYKWLIFVLTFTVVIVFFIQKNDSFKHLKKSYSNTKELNNKEKEAFAANNDNALDVRIFGAKGDGKADDTQAIQSAIDCGGNILIADGTFIVDSQRQSTVATDRGTIEQPYGDPSVCGIIIVKPCNIICRNATIKTKANLKASLGNSYLFAVNAENVSFSNVVIDGNRYNAEHSYGIQINDSNCNVTGLKAYRFDGSPLVINGSPQKHVDNIRVSNFYAENVGNTIFAAFSKNNVFQGIKSVNSSEGIDFDKLVSETIISDCYFEGGNRTKADAGIEINAGKNINIENVVAVNYRPVLLLNGKKINNVPEKSHDINMTNITSINSLGNGITIGNVFKNGDDIDSCFFSNITIVNPSYFGIQIRGTNCKYKNLLIKGANRTGIFSVNGARNIFVSGTIKDCKRNGIHISNTENFLIENVRVTDNNKENNNYYGVLLDGNNIDTKLHNVVISGKHQNALCSKGVNSIRVVRCVANNSLSSCDFCFSKDTTVLMSDNFGIPYQL